jgi:hypothetical protein
MLGLRRRSSHPTPAQAYEALSQRLCLYAPVSECSGQPMPVGLRDAWDVNDVLACEAHVGQLRKLDERRKAELERFLTKAFAR